MSAWRKLALGALAALALGGMALSEEVTPTPPAEVGEVDLLDPGVYVVGEDTPPPTATPIPTPGPDVTPIPYYSSPRYPEGQVRFEYELWAALTGDWGLEAFQAAALMGSVQAESNFSPYDVERVGADARGWYAYETGDGRGFGLCQWTSAGRKGNLLAFAERRGDAALVWDFDTQVAFMRQELDLEALKATKTLYEASEWAVLRYERPNLRYANSWPGTRYEKARALYRRHTGEVYEEDAPDFSVDVGEIALEPLPRREIEGADRWTATIHVKSNYYWRLSVTAEDPEDAPWLRVLAPGTYHPDRMEDCVCGYMSDGEKPLTLVLERLPEPGETWTGTLEFEIYWGNHLIRTVPVSITGAQNQAPAITLSRGRLARGTGKR